MIFFFLKKSLIPKFQLIPILRLQVMQNCNVHWHCSIDYRIKLSLVDETSCKKKNALIS